MNKQIFQKALTNYLILKNNLHGTVRRYSVHRADKLVAEVKCTITGTDIPSPVENAGNPWRELMASEGVRLIAGDATEWSNLICVAKPYSTPTNVDSYNAVDCTVVNGQDGTFELISCADFYNNSPLLR